MRSETRVLYPINFGYIIGHMYWSQLQSVAAEERET